MGCSYSQPVKDVRITKAPRVVPAIVVREPTLIDTALIAKLRAAQVAK
jgi:hypothetical protein